MAYRSFLTLLLVLAIAHFAPVAVPGANALQGMNLSPPALTRRAEHNQMAARMIKKRQQTGTNTPTGGANPSNTAPGNQNSGVTTPTGPTNTSGNTTPTPSETSNTNTNTRTTTTTSSSSSTSSATSTTPTSTSSTPTSTPSSSSSTTSRRTTSTLTRTESSAAASQTDDQSSDPDASFLPKPAIIGLIVTGSCIAAAAAIWTIIRKWKFSPSRHFEDRLEPINWEPNQSSGLPHDPTVAALARGGSQNGRTARGSLSSEEHGSVRNMTAVNQDQISMTPDFPPAHDFTAGAANLAPPGGYVDMYRGPSPGPNPYGQRGVSPAPSAAYGQQYDTPNPYDAYDYNAGYGQRRY